MKVLLTGGSGFIAAHVVDVLLKQGHAIVTTVRSQSKADKIAEAHPEVPKSKLDFAIVEDIAQDGCFDKAVKSDPPFEAVIHTASPFHFNVTDPQKDLIDPALIGTTGILKSIKKYAPSVKQVVITSSFASIINTKAHKKIYNEEVWNPVTIEEIHDDHATAYRASKTLAEKAAWEFVEKEKPNFTVTTLCPPIVLGPVVHYLSSLDALNTSNLRVRDMIQGKTKEKLPTSGPFIWVDVRDLAKAHVNAIEIPEAAGKRFFVTAGYFSTVEIANIIRDNFPDLKDKLPSKDLTDDTPEDLYGFDNSRSKDVLKVTYRSLKECIVDLVKSLQEIGA